MSNFLRIVQMTDVHVGPTPKPVHNINAQAHFLRVLQHLQDMSEELDLLVVSGDLAQERGEPKAYAWLREQLDKSLLPYVIMTGNHDVLSHMQTAFSLPESDIQENAYFYKKILKNRPLLFLDSGPYRVSKIQLDWLQQQCQLHADQECLLFVHHPPLPALCQFMDASHGLRNSQETWQVLRAQTNISHIFCGHYHTERTLVRDGKVIYITPSTTIQIDTRTEDFAIEHRMPAYRIVEWSDDTLYSHVHYLP